MANPKHLKILKDGAKEWNKWRASHTIKPDFKNAKLEGAQLGGAILYAANFDGADLRGAVLSGADISSAGAKKVNLTGADLSAANLNNTILVGASLGRANLRGANLSGASFRGACLHGANATHTDLSFTDFYEADLYMCLLREAKTYRTYLGRANLSFADLGGLNLRGINLKGSDLTRAHLEGANLEDTDLSYTSLVRCNLAGANLTGAFLYGASRDDWIIKDVECKYLYWDYERKQRSPKDRDLEPGEFERLYAALPTIEYIFDNGMSPIDPLIMDRVVQSIREEQPEFDIKIDSINARGLAPSVKFTVQHEEHKEPAFEAVQKEYEIRLKQLESERDRYYQLLARALDAPKEVKLINAAPGSIVATDGSTVSVEQYIHNALELQKAVAGEPDDSESFAKVAKNTALEIVGEAIKDIAKGQVKEAAKQIIELGKDLGPLLVRTAAYVFFSNVGT